MMSVLNEFTNTILHKIEPAYLRKGDRVTYNDKCWFVNSVKRQGASVCYGIEHWLTGKPNSVDQSELLFSREEKVGPIWTLDMFYGNDLVLHHEDITPYEDIKPLSIIVREDIWSPLTIFNWIQSEGPTTSFLILRTPTGHFVDGWIFYDCIVTSENSISAISTLDINYGYSTKIRPPFEFPTINWSQFFDGQWTGIAEAGEIKVTVYADGWHDCRQIGKMYQSSYQLLCIDFIKRFL